MIAETCACVLAGVFQKHGGHPSREDTCPKDAARDGRPSFEGSAKYAFAYQGKCRVLPEYG